MWHRTTKLLESMGLLTVADGDAIEDYCMAVVMADRIVEQLRKQMQMVENPFTLKTTNGCPIINPLVMTLKQINEEKRAFRHAFGFDPG